MLVAALRAVREYQVKCLLLAGGGSQQRLRRRCRLRPGGLGSRFLSAAVLCTDNAAMIACAAHYYLLAGQVAGWDRMPPQPAFRETTTQGPSLEEEIC